MGINEGCVLQNGFPSFLLRVLGTWNSSVLFRGLVLTRKAQVWLFFQSLASIDGDLGSAQPLAQY